MVVTKRLSWESTIPRYTGETFLIPEQTVLIDKSIRVFSMYLKASYNGVSEIEVQGEINVMFQIFLQMNKPAE